MLMHRKALLTQLFPMHLFSTPLKASENRKVFCIFKGVEKKFIGNKWINERVRVRLEIEICIVEFPK